MMMTNLSAFVHLYYLTISGTCNTYSYGVRAIIQCLPAWFRFVQCLRRYRDTKRAFPHLVNAGKYSTTFFVVTFAALYKTHKGERILWSSHEMRDKRCRFTDPLDFHCLNLGKTKAKHKQ